MKAMCLVFAIGYFSACVPQGTVQKECTSSRDCDGVCDVETGLCSDDKECSEAIQCEDGLVCRHLACSDECVAPAQRGESCYSSSDLDSAFCGAQQHPCADDFICEHITMPESVTGECVPLAGRGLNEVCVSDADCSDGLKCDVTTEADVGQQRCLLVEGNACVGSDQCVSGSCVGGFCVE